MSRKITYVQCTMTRMVAGGLERMVSYIPRQFAKLGKVLKLKNEQDEWQDGWIVRYVGSSADSESLPDYRKAIRNHRKSTGDSQPRRR